MAGPCKNSVDSNHCVSKTDVLVAGSDPAQIRIAGYALVKRLRKL